MHAIDLWLCKIIDLWADFSNNKRSGEAPSLHVAEKERRFLLSAFEDVKTGNFSSPFGRDLVRRLFFLGGFFVPNNFLAGSSSTWYFLIGNMFFFRLVSYMNESGRRKMRNLIGACFPVGLQNIQIGKSSECLNSNAASIGFLSHNRPSDR